MDTERNNYKYQKDVILARIIDKLQELKLNYDLLIVESCIDAIIKKDKEKK